MISDQLPPSVKQELNFLTTKDLLVLKNVAHELPKFTSLMQIRQVLKQYSPRLEKIAEQKAFKIMGVVAMKRAQLLPETKNAFHEVRFRLLTIYDITFRPDKCPRPMPNRWLNWSKANRRKSRTTWTPLSPMLPMFLTRRWPAN